MEEKTRECGNCRCWHDVGMEVSDCRKYPPVLPPFTTPEFWEGFGYWPQTHKTQWCCEHQWRE